MKAFRLDIASVILACLALSVLSGCTANADSGKVPITTSSETAKENYIKGRDLQEKLRATEARPYFEKAVAEDEDFAMAHLNLAFTAPSAKDFFASLEKAASLADKVSDGERLFILASQAIVNGDPAMQGEYCKQLVEKFPKDERAQNNLGTHYFGQQDWQKAINAYEVAVQINPDFSQPYNQLGYSYRFLGNYDEAEKVFKKYIEIIPNDPNPYDSYAELLMKTGRYKESIENYKKALEVNPKFVASHVGIATNYCYLRDGKSARKQLKERYELSENDGQRRGSLLAEAVTYVFEGEYEMALAAQKKAYKIAEKNNDKAAMSGNLGNMGNVLVESGQPAKAMAKFEESLQLILGSDLSQQQKDLAQQFHYFNTFQVAMAENKLTKAKKNTQKFKMQAEEKNNNFQKRLSHQMLGVIAMAEKNYDSAIAELKQANSQDPYNLYRLSLAYEGKGDSEMAKEYYMKAVDFNALNNLQQAFVFAKIDKEMTMKH